MAENHFCVKFGHFLTHGKENPELFLLDWNIEYFCLIDLGHPNPTKSPRIYMAIFRRASYNIYKSGKES